MIHNTGIRANLGDNSIRCEWSHRSVRQAIDHGDTMRKFTNQIAALYIAQGLFMVSMLFDRRL